MDSVKRLRKDFEALKSEVDNLKAKLESDLTPDAKRELAKSRQIPRSNYIPHDDVLAEFS